MTSRGYKKYMKKNVEKDYPLLKLFAVSFFGMLLVFTMLIKIIAKPVDVSIGDYKQDSEITEEMKNVDGRLAAIQDEDRGKSFSELMEKADDLSNEAETVTAREDVIQKETKPEVVKAPVQDPLYKVFIGNYTSSEQAKVAKDIIQDTGANLNPIVKCIGSNSYTLQVGIFKNKASAEALLYTVQQNHLPGRIVQEY